MQTCKIGTWNLCLGLANKKDLVKELLLKEKIDISCVQETDIIKDYPISLLTFPGFSLELEKNDLKALVGVYLNSRVKYKRRNDLEGINSHLVVIDILDNKHTRLINIYRSFNPQESISPREKFKQQLELIRLAMTHETIILGDFNIDFNKRFTVDFVHRRLFEDSDVALFIW